MNYLFITLDTKLMFTDECTTNTHDCHSFATCSNTPTSFTCACNKGYSGDGKSCNGLWLVCFVRFYGSGCSLPPYRNLRMLNYFNIQRILFTFFLQMSMNVRPILTTVICPRLAPILKVLSLVLVTRDIMVMADRAVVSCITNVFLYLQCLSLF